MNPQMIISLLPYLIVGGVSLGCIIYAWRQRRIAGALPFAWMVFLEAMWTATSAKGLLESYHPALQPSEFWETAQIIILAVWMLALLVFTWQYTRSRSRHAALLAVLAVSLTVIVVGLVMMHLWPDRFRPVSLYLPEQIMTISLYGIPLVNWLNVVWLGGLGLVSLILLFNRFIFPGSLSHIRISLILIGLIILVAGASAVRLNLAVPFYAGDLTPLAVVVSEFVIVFSLFTPRAIQLVPTARENVLANTADLIMTIDHNGRIADLNPAALSFISSGAAVTEQYAKTEIPGKPIEQVFPKWPEFVQYVQRGAEGSAELVTEMQEGQPRCFGVNLTPLQDHKGRLVGRLLVAHEITPQKQLEKSLQISEAQLQQTREALQAKETALLHTEQSLHVAESQLQQTTATLQQTEQTLHTTEVHLQQTTSRLRDTEATLSAAEMELQQTTTKLQETEITLSATETRLQQTDTELQKTKAALNASEEHIQQTTQKVQETETALNAAASQLQQTTTALQQTEHYLQARETELCQIQSVLQERETRLIAIERARQDDEKKLQQTSEALKISETTCQSLQKTLKITEDTAKASEEARRRVEEELEQAFQAVQHAPKPPSPDTSTAPAKHPNVPKGKRLSNAHVQTRLAQLLPDELRDLKDAAAQLNPFKIARVIEPLWGQDAALADALQTFAQQHNYKELLILIEKAQTLS